MVKLSVLAGRCVFDTAALFRFVSVSPHSIEVAIAEPATAGRGVSPTSALPQRSGTRIAAGSCDWV